MACKQICWWILCLISLKAAQSAKLYVIDPGNIYDDKDTENKTEIFYAPETISRPKSINFNQDLCQKISSNNDLYRLCIEATKQLSKSKSKEYSRNVFYIKSPKQEQRFQYQKLLYQPLKDHVGRQLLNPYLSQFSHDYLDVNDLGRSNSANFAKDYVDISDFRSIRSIVSDCNEKIDEFGQLTRNRCIPVSRKTLGLAGLNNFKFKVEDSSDEKPEEATILRKKKKNRYKVISKEDKMDSNDAASSNDKSDSDNKADDNNNESDDDKNKSDDDNNKTDDDNKEDVKYNVDSGASIQSSDSIEVTNKRPKEKQSKKEFSDNYMYMQGNKMYSQDDFRRNKPSYFREGNEGYNDDNFYSRFRRGLRMSHFLPKRYNWDEEDFQTLGYYWFNGPRGKYRNI